MFTLMLKTYRNKVSITFIKILLVQKVDDAIMIHPKSRKKEIIALRA
jgi:hypothetical protein